MKLHKIVHFAPYGKPHSTCGLTVPRATIWDPVTGDYSRIEPFTTRRRETTCEDCSFEFTSPDQPKEHA